MRVIVGQIRGLYGVRGWVKVFSYTDPITNIINYSPWFVNQKMFAVSQAKAHGKGIIAKFESINDRDEAVTLLGAELAIDHEQLPATATDEFYWHDLIGLTVINHEGITFGKVESLIATGANDVLVVSGERERLIPFVMNDVILEVNLVEATLLVNWDVDF
jgi:16S rRNA processing protein RimM